MLGESHSGTGLYYQEGFPSEGQSLFLEHILSDQRANVGQNLDSYLIAILDVRLSGSSNTRRGTSNNDRTSRKRRSLRQETYDLRYIENKIAKIC